METLATIFDIQRFSIHDGPGIRTTIFFKGCPLRCLWCQNPESHKPGPEVAFYEERCARCFLCKEVCPEDGIVEARDVRIDGQKCTACGKCVSACPRKLIAIENYEPSEGMVIVSCSSRDRGADVKKICPVGCIGCGLCVKHGPEGAFVVENNLSVMSYEDFPGMEATQTAIEECPANCIVVVPTRHI